VWERAAINEIAEVRITERSAPAFSSRSDTLHSSWKTDRSPDHLAKAALARPVKPTSTAPAEPLQRAVGVEHFDGSAGRGADHGRTALCQASIGA
jgi:hypothetical protein